MSHLLRAAAISLAIGSTTTAVLAGSYEFVPAPQTNLSLLYRLDKVTGELIACRYGLKEGAVGVTICYPSGEGATAQQPGEYQLVPSHNATEGGIFRVDLRNGGVSVCYLYKEDVGVVCTPWSR